MEQSVRDPRVSGTHLAVIDTLAKELQLPVDEVTGVYFDEISRLEAEARIRTFVPVLAVNRVRNELRRRR